MPRFISLAAFAATLLGAASTGFPAQSVESSPAAVLDRYAAGQTEEAVRGVTAIRNLAGWTERFKRESVTWIQQSDRPALRRRQSAAFVLELTRARLESDWRLLRDLVELTCTDLQAAGPPDAFERAWHMAVLSLAGRARDRIWLLGDVPTLPGAKPRRQTGNSLSPKHLTHAAERLDNSAAVQLEWIVAYSWGADREPMRGAVDMNMFESLTRPMRRIDSIRSLQPLVNDPTVGAEARLRLAQAMFASGEYAAAQTAAASRELYQGDPKTAYVAHVIAARALDAQGKREAAADEYARALDVIPDGEAASLGLTALTMASDDAEIQIDRLRVALPLGSAGTDPWRLFLYGSFRYWPERIAAVRAELAR